MNYETFFGRKAEIVARELIGRLLMRIGDKGTTTCEITETGAYEGGSETPSRAGMKYGPGRIFLMPYRGTYLFNIATGKEGEPSCVEIRELGFHNRRLKGSGLIASELDITTKLNGVMLGKEVLIEVAPAMPSLIIIERTKGKTPNCVGYFIK